MRTTGFVVISLTFIISSGSVQAQMDERLYQASCPKEAAAHHGVNPDVLKAIIQVESRGNPKAINHNRNNTLDVGRGQINSIHFPELKKYGISSDDLLYGCVNDFVSAWLLRRAIERHGNTWFGIAAYHSATPKHNHRYQGLIYKEINRQRRLRDKD